MIDEFFEQWIRVKIQFVWLISAVPDNYVHRLVASKTDGKMVQYECEGDTCHAEKIDALQLEASISWSRCSIGTQIMCLIIINVMTRTCL